MMVQEQEKRRYRTVVQVSMPTDLLDAIDEQAPKGERSAFILEAIRSELARRERKRLEAAR